MLTKCLFSLLPILVSIFTLWVNYIHGDSKNKNTLIDTLAKELSSKNTNPYVVQACISKLHKSRAISYRVLNKLIRYDNAFEIIQLISSGRKILDIFKLKESGVNITVEYSDVYKSKSSRIWGMVLCFAVTMFCYYLSITTISKLLDAASTIQAQNSLISIIWDGFVPDMCELLFSMIMTFVFSWQFLILFLSSKRIDRIQTLLDIGSLCHGPLRRA
ncbi:hypothetical protein PU345_003712 [Enterobacter kobei]|nr:hypothetical protein [Enterobacter kobei]